MAKYNKIRELARAIQDGATLERMFAGAEYRQRDLIGLAIDGMIRIVAEEMLKSSADFNAFKERGLIKDGVTEEMFKAATVDDAESVSSDSLRNDVVAMKNKRVLITSDDLATKEEVSSHITFSISYKAAMDQYQEEVREFAKKVATIVETATNYAAALAEYTDAVLDYGDGKAGALPRIPKAPVLPREMVLPKQPELHEGIPLERPKDPRIERINKIAEGIIKIRESGVKGSVRADDKSQERDVSEITDITRITLIPATPEIADRMVDIMSAVRDYADTGDTLRVSGYMKRDFGVVVGDFVSEVQIISQGQDKAYETSHKIYRTTRRMENDDGQFDLAEISDSDRITIRKEYNDLMKEFKESHPITMELFKKGKYREFSFAERPMDDFKGDKLTDRYEELLRLHQAIHFSEVVHSLQEGNDIWAKKYLELANDLNRRRKSSGHEGIPQDMMETVPSKYRPSAVEHSLR